MTSGTVAKIGWLPLGGYRIGIRASHGGYFYYAHLASYEKNFQIGEPVKAGQILGYMGDTGYGEEGTAGRIPGASSSWNLYRYPGGRGAWRKSLLCFTGYGEKSEKIHVLITNFSKYML